MYFEYRRCLTSRWISTRRVFCILSRVTTPTSVRRTFRAAVSGLVVSAGMVAQSSVSGRGGGGGGLLQFPLPLQRLDPGDVPPGLPHHARRLQPVGRRLEAEVEQGLLGVAEGRGQVLVRHLTVFGSLHRPHSVNGPPGGGRTGT